MLVEKVTHTFSGKQHFIGLTRCEEVNLLPDWKGCEKWRIDVELLQTMKRAAFEAVAGASLGMVMAR